SRLQPFRNITSLKSHISSNEIINENGRDNYACSLIITKYLILLQIFNSIMVLFHNRIMKPIPQYLIIIFNRILNQLIIHILDKGFNLDITQKTTNNFKKITNNESPTVNLGIQTAEEIKKWRQERKEYFFNN
ncbi:hypothetical protein HZS_768, partial [Henneguya salminicola]